MGTSGYGSSNQYIPRELHRRFGRGSPSLVGRGIANRQENFNPLSSSTSPSQSSRPPPSAAAKRTFADANWEQGFAKYVIEKHRNKRSLISRARKYGYVLTSGDASELLTMTDASRRHTMEALAALSKYLGLYPEWKELRERYQLKWSSGDSFDVFEAIYNSKVNYKVMMEWLKDVYSRIPRRYGDVLLFDTLTGLRPEEACISIHFLRIDTANYLSQSRPVMEHFKYKDAFIRKTKKAYISVVTPRLLKVAQRADDTNWNAIRHVVNKARLEMHMKYCRQIFASYLRANKIDSEVINLLQGRIEKSIFVRHYNRPDMNEVFANVKAVVERLTDEFNEFL